MHALRSPLHQFIPTVSEDARKPERLPKNSETIYKSKGEKAYEICYQENLITLPSEQPQNLETIYKKRWRALHIRKGEHEHD